MQTIVIKRSEHMILPLVSVYVCQLEIIIGDNSCEKSIKVTDRVWSEGIISPP